MFKINAKSVYIDYTIHGILWECMRNGKRGGDYGEAHKTEEYISPAEKEQLADF